MGSLAKKQKALKTNEREQKMLQAFQDFYKSAAIGLKRFLEGIRMGKYQYRFWNRKKCCNCRYYQRPKAEAFCVLEYPEWEKEWEDCRDNLKAFRLLMGVDGVPEKKAKEKKCEHWLPRV
jgi:hypothetical protein